MPTLADKPKLDRDRLRHARDEGAAVLAEALEVLANAFARAAEHLRRVAEGEAEREEAILTQPDVQDALAIGLRELREAREQREQIP